MTEEQRKEHLLKVFDAFVMPYRDSVKGFEEAIEDLNKLLYCLLHVLYEEA